MNFYLMEVIFIFILPQIMFISALNFIMFFILLIQSGPSCFVKSLRYIIILFEMSVGLIYILPPFCGAGDLIKALTNNG